MGKIEYIKKARKEHKCSKCGKVVAVGEPYKKGVINFHPDIVVCNGCPLKSYEVTTSAYCKEVGCIVEDWSENYSVSSDGISEIVGVLEGLRDEVEGSLENVPENLKEATTGELLQNRLDQLEEAIEALNDIDEDSMRSEAEDEARNNLDEDAYESSDDYEADVEEQAGEIFEENLSQAIDEALSSLEY